MDRGELWMVVVVVPAHKAKVQLIKVTTTKVAELVAEAEAAAEAEAENCLTKLRPCGLCIVCE